MDLQITNYIHRAFLKCRRSTDALKVTTNTPKEPPRIFCLRIICVSIKAKDTGEAYRDLPKVE